MYMQASSSIQTKHAFHNKVLSVPTAIEQFSQFLKLYVNIMN